MEQETSRFLRQIPLFQDLNSEEIQPIAAITIPRFVSRKGIVFTEGGEKEAVFLIREGVIKTYKTDENGHEQIVSFLKNGDIFPHTGFFNPHPYPATAEAIMDTRLLAIPVRLFEQLMQDTPSIAIKMMRVMGEKILELQEKIQELSGQDVKHRALSFLLKLSEQHGERKENKIVINLPMTHQEFANAIGTSRETINRLLNQLSKENIVSIGRSRIVIIDLDALKQQRGYK